MCKTSPGSSGLSRWVSLVSLTLCVVVPLGLLADAPAWWTDRYVLTPGAAPDDYAAANQGQLKHVAKQAYEEMEANLPGGAGSALDALWADPVPPGTDDYSAINLGQLKYIAEPFYVRLVDELGYTGQPLAPGQTRPWTGTAADDYALANLGQLKFVFSFDLIGFVPPTIDPYASDSDGDGIGAGWEIEHGFDPLLDDSGSPGWPALVAAYQQSLLIGADPAATAPAGLVVYTP